jgi:hypothetical protein
MNCSYFLQYLAKNRKKLTCSLRGESASFGFTINQYGDMVNTPDWLAVVEGQIIVCLNPSVLTQIQHDNFEDSDRHVDDQETIYRLSSQSLLQVLASSVGLTKVNRQGAIVIWTYYSDTNDNFVNDLQNLSQRSPILRTLINIDGDMHQKVCYEILEHPLGDRILRTHGYIIGQISGQFKTVIGDYLEAKLRPLTIAAISMVTVFAWCDPLHKLSQKLHLPDFIFSNCWQMTIAAPLTVLIIWWINSKLPFRLPTLINSQGNFDRQSRIKLLQKFGKDLLKLLETPIFRFIAIGVIAFLFLTWLLITVVKLPVDHRIILIVNNIESYIEPYLPIAIISLRKLIMENLGTIFFKSAFIVKFIFGRFVRQ